MREKLIPNSVSKLYIFPDMTYETIFNIFNMHSSRILQLNYFYLDNIYFIGLTIMKIPFVCRIVLSILPACEVFPGDLALVVSPKLTQEELQDDLSLEEVLP